MGKDLKPQMGHFIAGPIPGHDAAWRVVWVGEVFAGVVVRILHGDRASLGQRHGSRVAVDSLPVQIPLRDVNERFCGAPGKSCESEQVLAEIVRVRIDREQIHIYRKRKFIRDDKMFFAGRDVELPVVFQLEQQREEGCGLVGEIKT